MNNIPLVNFHFRVEWGGTRIGFTEVSGLDIRQEVIEYREGSEPQYSVHKIPGMRKYPNIILKRGTFKSDNEFFDWYKTIKLNTVEKRDVVISLLDEEHNPTVVWKVKSAWPVMLKSTELNSSHCEIAIETLEIAHDGLIIQNE